MFKVRMIAVITVLAGALLGWCVYLTENPDSNYNFKFGLDLDGGTHLAYKADTSNVASADIPGAMDSLRQTVERRINIFGVSEPIVQVETVGLFSDEGSSNRLIVELPGVTDVNQAIELIGKTPILEFKLVKEGADFTTLTNASTTDEYLAAMKDLYVDTGLTGAELERASLVFAQGSPSPIISLKFNETGRTKLATLTKENIGEIMAIFLDGVPLSAPVIRDEIITGEAQITGQFTPDEAKQLVQDLNYGALPLPITLIETQTIGATLGNATLNAGITALIYGVIAIFIFMLIWYRLPGVIATVALIFYVILMLLAFKFVPVVLTASGVAGLVLSLGMGVDANVLIFERIKEELKKGSTTYDAVKEGIKRAWPSIRDGNLSSLISAVVLYWLSGTSVVKGFALVLGIGVLISILSSVVISRILLLAVSSKTDNKVLKILFSTGFGKFN